MLLLTGADSFALKKFLAVKKRLRKTEMFCGQRSMPPPLHAELWPDCCIREYAEYPEKNLKPDEN